ncbi:hypothetical protein JVT76_005505, partial [Escherichia coli]|nr:hypothetical protein [Escherichia coli]EEV3888967.1 hypothetical protein [Escherichia coli]EFA1488697.1 hypothetical protein [Escherichia coli]EHC0807665.1 hypothetical protein [Escherichia coli]EIB7619971.1 hypothetical protein [Escherichia coli]
MLHIISPRGISPRQRRLFYPFSSALALFYYAAAFTSGTMLSISTQYVVLLVTNIITINRHRISPVYRNRVKKPEPESNHRMTICQWQVIKKRPRHAQPELTRKMIEGNNISDVRMAPPAKFCND